MHLTLSSSQKPLPASRPTSRHFVSIIIYARSNIVAKAKVTEATSGRLLLLQSEQYIAQYNDLLTTVTIDIH